MPMLSPMVAEENEGTTVSSAETIQADRPQADEIDLGVRRDEMNAAEHWLFPKSV